MYLGQSFLDNSPLRYHVCSYVITYQTYITYMCVQHYGHLWFFVVVQFDFVREEIAIAIIDTQMWTVYQRL